MILKIKTKKPTTAQKGQYGRARALMKRADVDNETIAIVLKKMHQATGEH